MSRHRGGTDKLHSVAILRGPRIPRYDRITDTEQNEGRLSVGIRNDKMFPALALKSCTATQFLTGSAASSSQPLKSASRSTTISIMIGFLKPVSRSHVTPVQNLLSILLGGTQTKTLKLLTHLTEFMMADETLKLVIGNRKYSSWSMRGWLAAKHSRLPFEEVFCPAGST